MKILYTVPSEYRHILHKTLSNIKGKGETHAFATGNDKYYEISDGDFRRLNLASAVEQNGERRHIGFKRLSEIFAREERIIPWWMWKVFSLTEKGEVIRTEKLGKSSSTFARQDVIDLMIDELKKRAGFFSSDSSQIKDEKENEHIESQYVPYAGAMGGENFGHSEQARDKYNELHNYIESLGLDSHIAAQIKSNPELTGFMASMQEISTSQLGLAEVQSQLAGIKKQLEGIGVTGAAADDFIGRIRQAKETRDEAMLVAFLKTQVENAINQAIMQHISLNPELYYLIPALASYSEREKMEMLTNNLAYLQQVLANQRASLFAHNNAISSDMPVVLHLGEKIVFHLDNIKASCAHTNPEVSDKIGSLEAGMKAIASKLSTLPEIADAIKNEKGALHVDVETLFNETAKLSPNDASQLTDMARQITQVFGEPPVQHQTVAQVAEGTHIKALDATLKGDGKNAAVTFDAQTHQRVEHILPEVQAAVVSAVSPASVKVAEVENIRKVVDEAVNFDVNLRYSIEQAASLVGQGMRDAGFKDNEFKMSEYRPDIKSVAVEASLEQAMELANKFRHQNLAHHQEPHKHEPGRGV